MYVFTRRQAGRYRALAVSVALIYLAITSMIPLMHSDDCAFSGRSDARSTSFPSEGPCPACKFLAGSNSVELPYDVAPVLAQAYFTAESAPEATVFIANLCTGSIILRAPPTSSLT
jgi:hypothetical protein